jgi:hypothetical protein
MAAATLARPAGTRSGMHVRVVQGDHTATKPHSTDNSYWKVVTFLHKCPTAHNLQTELEPANLSLHLGNTEVTTSTSNQCICGWHCQSMCPDCCRPICTAGGAPSPYSVNLLCHQLQASPFVPQLPTTWLPITGGHQGSSQQATRGSSIMLTKLGTSALLGTASIHLLPGMEVAAMVLDQDGPPHDARGGSLEDGLGGGEGEQPLGGAGSLGDGGLDQEG